jgi:single-strand DNA-binding protein
MINTVIIQGRLTADIELRNTQSGKSVTSFTVAVDTGYGDKKVASFLDCVAWDKTTIFIQQYFSKGSLIIVEGRLQTRSYEDKQGNKRKVTEIVANQIHFAESKKNGFDEIERNVKAAGIDIQPVESDFTEIGMNDSQLPF